MASTDNNANSNTNIKICQICDEKINKSTRLLVCCPYCEFSSCRTCCETYILNESICKCMNPSCNREWNRQFIRSAFTLVFINTRLKNHREQLLFDRERALLPSTQPFVEHEIISQRNRVEIDEIDNTIRKAWLEYIKIRNTLYIRREFLVNEMHSNSSRIITRNEFVRECPDEDCRGFLSTQWKCGICNQWTCPLCHEVKGIQRDIEHTCNPDNVATASLLSRDTKPCPKCRVGIYKIDGCDQMWCTQCHTAFSWRTGRIENNIHNPHYYEWARRNGQELARNPLDNPCNQEHITHATYLTINRLIRIINPNTNIVTATNLKKMQNIIRNVIHLRGVELDRYRVDGYELRNRDLRIKYMMKNITEIEFKKMLQILDKKYLKNQEIYGVFEIIINTATDIILRCIQEIRDINTGVYGDNVNRYGDVESILINSFNQLDNIINYANECIVKINHTYNSSIRLVSSDLSI